MTWDIGMWDSSGSRCCKEAASGDSPPSSRPEETPHGPVHRDGLKLAAARLGQVGSPGHWS